MKKVVDDPRLMMKVCDLYYNQDIGQQQIGKQLGLSRPTIARLLSSAREQGIVQIKIPDLDTIKYWELEKRLEEQYGLLEAMIVEPGSTEEDTKAAMGSAAARYLQYKIKDGMTVGISMGSTLYHMVSRMEYTSEYPAIHALRAEGLRPSRYMTAEGVTFVPLIGGMGMLRMELHANSLAEGMARMYNGAFVPLHAPARVSSAQIRNELMKEESLASAIELLGRLDIALIGIGYPNEHSAIKATGYYKENEIESLLERGAAGELCMQFYDREGDTAPYRSDNNVIGIDIRRLRKIPCSIGIAGGLEKLSAIRGAIQGRYINTLITDAECALALVSEE